MAVQSGTTNAPFVNASAEVTGVYQQGIVAGVIGAATVAVWFFLIDLFQGRPFYTPNVLGAALFHRSGELDLSLSSALSFESVVMYTWVHGMIFCLIGGVAAKLLALAEGDLHLGFGILLLFIVFEFGFVAAAFIVAEPILHVLAWPLVLVGNLLGAVTMTIYFWRHHPNLQISP
jgi:hypothetical protein